MCKWLKQNLYYILGTAICIGLLSHVLKIDDSLIGVMACAGKIVAGICYALATEEWVYYLGVYFIKTYQLVFNWINCSMKLYI